MNAISERHERARRAEQAFAERRTRPRAERLGTAHVGLSTWCILEYDLRNLSASGAWLSGGPCLEHGRRVEVLLRVTGLRPLLVPGRVSRSSPEGMAISFHHVEPNLEDLLQDVVLAALSGRYLQPLPSDCTMTWEPLAP